MKTKIERIWSISLIVIGIGIATFILAGSSVIGIELPDIKLVEFSTIDQRNGWGDHFDGTKLSIILNK